MYEDDVVIGFSHYIDNDSRGVVWNDEWKVTWPSKENGKFSVYCKHSSSG